MMTNRSRWSPDEKIRIVLESLNTNISMAELCRKYNVTPVTFYAWKEKFVQGGKLALSGQLKDPAKEKQAEIRPAEEADRRADDRQRGDEGGPREEREKNERRDHDEQGD